jgi:hypothetical protein
MHDNNISDVQVWIDRIWKDVDSHSIFANIVLKVETLNILVKALQLMMMMMIIAVFLSRHFSGR